MMVILTHTRSQEALAQELGAASLLIDLHQPAESARRIADWLENSEIQKIARSNALRLGRKRFNWDFERSKLISLIQSMGFRLGEIPR